MSSVSAKDIFNAIAPLVGENGHYEVFQRNSLSLQQNCIDIKLIFDPNFDLEKKDAEYDNLVGHYGVGGEFGNGVGNALIKYICLLEPVLSKRQSESILENGKAIRMAFDHVAAVFYDRTSQKSKYHPDDEAAKYEKSGAAVERALQSLHNWIETSRQNAGELLPSKRKIVLEKLEQMTRSVEQCEKSFAKIENLAQLTSFYAAQHNHIPSALETREDIGYVGRTLRSLNRLHS